MVTAGQQNQHASCNFEEGGGGHYLSICEVERFQAI